MIYNNQTVRQISEEEKVTFGIVIRAVLALYHRNQSLTPLERLNFECHSICFVLAKSIPGLTAVNGCYVGISQVWKKGKLIDWKAERRDHGWLTTKPGNIIDPHPVAIIAREPILVIGKGELAHFGSGLYIPGHIDPKRYDNPSIHKQCQALCDFFSGIDLKPR